MAGGGSGFGWDSATTVEPGCSFGWTAMAGGGSGFGLAGATTVGPGWIFAGEVTAGAGNGFGCVAGVGCSSEIFGCALTVGGGSGFTVGPFAFGPGLFGVAGDDGLPA
jgi:hypothetical protein